MAAAKKNHPSLLPHTKSQENDKLESIKNPSKASLVKSKNALALLNNRLKVKNLSLSV